MENKVTVENKDNGNIVFSYQRVKYRDTNLRIVIPLVFTIGIMFYELMKYGTLYFQILCIPILLYLSYRWMKYTEDKNISIERQLIYEYLDNIIKKDIQSIGRSVYELERKYVIEEKEYSMGARYLLILLSDGAEIKYNVINPKCYNKIQVLEIERQFQQYESNKDKTLYLNKSLK